MKPSFVDIRPGVMVSSNGRNYQITHVLGLESVLAKDLETLMVDRLRVDLLRPADVQNGADGKRDLSDFSEEEWMEGQKRFEVISPLLQSTSRTRKMAEDTAKSAGVNVATIYEWLKLYSSAGHVSALIPRKAGRKSGTKLLTAAAEKILESAIQDLFLSKQRHRPQDVIQEVFLRCRTAGVEPPHPNTVRNRIRDLPPSVVMRRRGMRDQARNQFAPILGKFPGASFPLSVVQIDHTEVNLIVVEEETRLPMGRPWITLAIDVFSRMVVGCYITMEKPSAASVGMCLSRGILPKREYLAALEVPGEWPVWGVCKTVHADNAREFRGLMLRRACEEYNIDLQWRPVKLPHYGGHIERLMGTSAEEFRKLPGTTFASPEQRKGYDSEKESALTLREFERHFTDFIVNVYHRRVHSELNVPPRRQWEIGVVGDQSRPGIGIPAVPGDPERIRLDFMPMEERTVQQYGIALDCIEYYDEVLNRWIGSTDPANSKEKRRFVVRYDPRDISKIYFFDPEAKQYFEVPYRSPHLPPISMWELRMAKKRLREEGRRHVDENALFEAIARMRQRVKDSVDKTKAARRQFHRLNDTARAAKPAAATPVAPMTPKVKAESLAEDDIFAMPIIPFNDRAVKS